MQPARFLVTGGSQGIGAAVVELASKAGHQVVFTGRNEATHRDDRARRPARMAFGPTSL